MMTTEVKTLAYKLLAHLSVRCLLFGSQARGDAGKFSDYDFLVVVRDFMNSRDKIHLASSLRTQFAENGVDADIIIKSQEEIDYYKDKPGHIVKHALAEGVLVW